MTNTPVDTIEKRDKRVRSKYNPSLVGRIDIPPRHIIHGLLER